MSSIRRAVSERSPSRETLVVAVLAGIAGVAGSFAVASYTPAFVVGPVAGFLARRLPGWVVTFGIVVLGDAGDQLNVAVAAALTVALFAAASLAATAARRRLGRPHPVVGTAALTTLLAFAITGALPASLAAGVAAGLVVAVAGVARRGFLGSLPRSSVEGRRQVLGAIASAAAVVLGGYLVGVRAESGSSAPDPPDVGDPWSGPEVESLLAEAEEKSLDVDGLEPLVSDRFYTVDINSTDPDVDANEWALSVTGTVDEKQTYTYEDIASRNLEHRFVSLRCVGEALNGRKMDNALWSGVPIMDLVEPAGPAENCCVMLRAADGYYEEFPLSALQDGFLAVGMNGEPLPRAHGYPARALIPGHWGEINVKWITEIEVLEQEVDGYWEERGWHGTGPVNTVAKLHAVDQLSDGRVRVGGHAYAGTRGIDLVEVSTDGGETWAEATLSEPLPGDDVWRQWTYAYDPPESDHEVVVRATDGTGERQPREESSPFPSGPTGWVSQTVQG